MGKTAAYINDWASISPMGCDRQKIWQKYLEGKSQVKRHQIGNKEYFCGTIPKDCEPHIDAIRSIGKTYQDLDRSVILALYCAEQLIQNTISNCGVNIGSSRGATGALEEGYQEFLQAGRVRATTSPYTTAGNVSTWVAQHLKLTGWNLSHSITCSTALHAVVNGIAWIKSGMAGQFLAGGTEAPLTPFTMAQLEAMRIYTREPGSHPVRAMDLKKKENTMTLGEGAALFLLSSEPKGAIAKISGIGFHQEAIKHGTSVTENGEGIYQAMKQALDESGISTPDVIVTHSPGTLKGDASENTAIQRLFGQSLPMITNNKWVIGHTYGTSGGLSLDMALLLLLNQSVPSPPWLKNKPIETPKSVLVNAQGFGGNAISILVEKI